jgi:hypothetical protein
MTSSRESRRHAAGWVRRPFASACTTCQPAVVRNTPLTRMAPPATRRSSSWWSGPGVKHRPGGRRQPQVVWSGPAHARRKSRRPGSAGSRPVRSCQEGASRAPSACACVVVLCSSPWRGWACVPSRASGCWPAAGHESQAGSSAPPVVVATARLGGHRSSAHASASLISPGVQRSTRLRTTISAASTRACQSTRSAPRFVPMVRGSTRVTTACSPTRSSGALASMSSTAPGSARPLGSTRRRSGRCPRSRAWIEPSRGPRLVQHRHPPAS